MAEISELTAVLQVGMQSHAAPRAQDDPPAGFTFGDAGGNSCPPGSQPLTKEECIQFGNDTKVDYGWKGYMGGADRSSRPLHCYKCNADGKVFFNIGGGGGMYSGSGSMKHSVICKPAADCVRSYEDGCAVGDQLTEEQCKLYAEETTGKRWIQPVTKKNRPSGCYYCKDDGKTLYNSNQFAGTAPTYRHGTVCQTCGPARDDPCDAYDEGCVESNTPLTQESCEAYAKCLGQVRSWNPEKSLKYRLNRPYGCYFCKNDGKTFFNTRLGALSDKHTRVCLK